MNVHERPGRFPWKPLAELAGTDASCSSALRRRRPNPTGKPCGRWADDGMSALTSEREAELREREDPDYVVNAGPGGVFDITWARFLRSFGRLVLAPCNRADVALLDRIKHPRDSSKSILAS